jgi:hypothetical protein
MANLRNLAISWSSTPDWYGGCFPANGLAPVPVSMNRQESGTYPGYPGGTTVAHEEQRVSFPGGRENPRCVRGKPSLGPLCGTARLAFMF